MPGGVDMSCASLDYDESDDDLRKEDISFTGDTISPPFSFTGDTIPPL